MNTQRAVIWAGFLGVSAALAWVPDHWFGQDDGVAAFAGKPAPATESAASMVGAGLPAKGRNRPPRPVPNPAMDATQNPGHGHRTTGYDRTCRRRGPDGPGAAFQFIGRMGDRDDLQVFLQSGEKLYVVRQGDVIEDTYRLDRVSASELNLVYLPLHQSQTLSVGSAP